MTPQRVPRGYLWCRYPYGNDQIDVRDGEVDSVTCGAGTDSVQADAADVVAGDCETVTRAGGGPRPEPTPSGGSGAGGGGQGGTGSQPVQSTRPLLSQVGSPRLGQALRHGVRLRVTGAHGSCIALVARKGDRVVASGSARVVGGRATVLLRFRASARRALRGRVARMRVSGGGTSATLTLRR